MVEPRQSPLLALQRATHLTLQRLAHELASHELTASEVNVLAIMSDGRGRTIAQVGLESGTRATTLTGVLDRLERRGYVDRRPDEQDRRATRIDLTSSGSNAARLVWEAVQQVEAATFDRCSPAQMEAFTNVLNTVSSDSQ